MQTVMDIESEKGITILFNVRNDSIRTRSQKVEECTTGCKSFTAHVIKAPFPDAAAAMMSEAHPLMVR